MVTDVFVSLDMLSIMHNNVETSVEMDLFSKLNVMMPIQSLGMDAVRPAF